MKRNNKKALRENSLRVESIHTVPHAEIEMPEEKTGQIQKIPVGHGTDGQVVGDITASIQRLAI
jgi:hypothetical protein